MFREYCFGENVNAITRRMMKMSQRKKNSFECLLRFPHCVDAIDGKHVIVQTQCIFAIQLLYEKLK